MAVGNEKNSLAEQESVEKPQSPTLFNLDQPTAYLSLSRYLQLDLDH